DCWLLAAIASLTCNEVLLNKVVPPEQNFTDEYCGLFKFNIWHEGDWTEVVVDDRLPSYMDSLVFMHSADKHEFWSALLEKAYAKLHGSYESLKGGSTSEAMEDFTGGVTEMFDLKKAPKDLLTIMLKAHDRGSLMGCSIDADPNQLEAELANGLIMGHAYSVTAVKMVEIQTPGRSGKLPMVRCRNPWGNESEWKGAFSDESERWKYITDSDKEEIGLTQEDDGEFWMTFGDWQSNFQKLEICNLGPDSLDDDELVKIGKKRWEATSEVGEWIPNVNAGGCRNYLQTFFTNPQYRVTVTDPDEDEDDLCTILVGVLQKDRRKKRKEGLDMLTIGYVIYKLKDPDCGPLDVDFFKYNASVAKSPSFINLREVCGRHMLQPGTYCIIPSTFEPHNKGEYLLRIFTEKANVTQ
ncbi:calpain, invertebrate, partial [Mytilus galloprovincialis]